METLQRSTKSNLPQWCKYIERKEVLPVAPHVVWQVLTSPSSYDSWCDFKLSGGVIYHNTQIYMRSRESPEKVPSTRLTVSQFIEPSFLQFRAVTLCGVCLSCPAFMEFQLNQIDENETEIIYRRSNPQWISLLIVMIQLVYVSIIYSSLAGSDAQTTFLPFFLVNLFIMVIFTVITFFQFFNIASKLQGSLTNLKHVLSTSPIANESPAHVEVVQVSTIQPLEIRNPMNPITSKV